MSEVIFGQASDEAEEPRPLFRSLWRGARSRCPNCGTGRLFHGWLRPVDRCASCSEDYTAQRADDLPPYLVIFIVGHVVVAGFMIAEEMVTLTAWQHLAIWTPITLAMSLLLMRPIKGATIGLQWSRRMFGFGGSGSEEASFDWDRTDHRS